MRPRLRKCSWGALCHHKHLDKLEVCCTCLMQMTQLVIPGMAKRRRGAIVNIGSAASTLLPAGPLLSVYAATKVGALAAEAVATPQSHLSCLLHIPHMHLPLQEGAGPQLPQFVNLLW